MGCAVFMQRAWPYRSSACTRSHPDENLVSFQYPVFLFSLAQCNEALLLGNSVILTLLPPVGESPQFRVAGSAKVIALQAFCFWNRHAFSAPLHKNHDIERIYLQCL